VRLFLLSQDPLHVSQKSSQIVKWSDSQKKAVEIETVKTS